MSHRQLQKLKAAAQHRAEQHPSEAPALKSLVNEINVAEVAVNTLNPQLDFEELMGELVESRLQLQSLYEAIEDLRSAKPHMKGIASINLYRLADAYRKDLAIS